MGIAYTVCLCIKQIQAFMLRKTKESFRTEIMENLRKFKYWLKTTVYSSNLRVWMQQMTTGQEYCTSNKPVEEGLLDEQNMQA